MLKDIDLKKIAVLVDFDGTITTEDTNNKMVSVYGNHNTDSIGDDFRDGKLTFPAYFQAVISELRLTEKEYINFLLEEIEISPGFLEFYRNIKEKNIPFGILSGGFENGIIPFLKMHGIEDVEIFANRLIFEGNKPHIKFLNGEDTHCCNKGPCGNCKINHYYNYKEKREKVIFVGDGVTDMPVANVAETVFAKDSLADYMDKRNIDYIPYDDFEDINKIIF